VRLELRPVAATFRRRGWQRAFGSSGTVRAVHDVALALGLAENGLTLDAVEDVIAEMIDAGRLDNLALPGLGADRVPVFPGGIVILAEAMRALEIERLDVSTGALREGLLYDMLGRLTDEDARERSVRTMQRRYRVDLEQAARVEATVLALYRKAARGWQLEDERSKQLLAWAARLHEVGLAIAHARYHHHGGYLIANSDLPGFVRLEQQLLATLVTLHRRKLDDPFLDELPGAWRAPMLKLVVLLRLAVLLNRSLSPAELPNIGLEPGKSSLALEFPPRWLDDNPLTAADLEQEREWLAARGFRLEVGGRSARS
jgi:exopolyphosphatase/guanosine-5'-triphosphate,3'-diphosphate pyrophosphatase